MVIVWYETCDLTMVPTLSNYIYALSSAWAALDKFLCFSYNCQKQSSIQSGFGNKKICWIDKFILRNQDTEIFLLALNINSF